MNGRLGDIGMTLTSLDNKDLKSLIVQSQLATCQLIQNKKVIDMGLILLNLFLRHQLSNNNYLKRNIEKWWFLADYKKEWCPIDYKKNCIARNFLDPGLAKP